MTGKAKSGNAAHNCRNVLVRIKVEAIETKLETDCGCGSIGLKTHMVRIQSLAKLYTEMFFLSAVKINKTAREIAH